jgi:hypothetical protein
MRSNDKNNLKRFVIFYRFCYLLSILIVLYYIKKIQVMSVDLIPARGHLSHLAMTRQPNSSASVSIH